MRIVRATAVLICAFSGCQDKPSAPDLQVNPESIAAAKRADGEELTAWLVPDPATVDFSELKQWHRFTLKISGGTDRQVVRVEANGWGLENVCLGLTRWEPSTGTCYAWPRARLYLRHNSSFYVAACTTGTSYLEVQEYTQRTDERGNPAPGLIWGPLEVYKISSGDTNFDIDLVFEDRGLLTWNQRGEIERAARRWESIIVGDVEDALTPYGAVDDLRILVRTFDDSETRAWGRGGVRFRRRVSHLPTVSTISFNLAHMEEIERRERLYLIALHEIGHALGFTDGSWMPYRSDLIRNPSWNDLGADAHFIGSKAIATFNRLGGWRYKGHKVPLENQGSSRDSHWRSSVFLNEIMDPFLGYDTALSEITIAAFEDMGYQVDYSQADYYRVPIVYAYAKPVVHQEGWCEVIEPEGWD